MKYTFRTDDFRNSGDGEGFDFYTFILDFFYYINICVLIDIYKHGGVFYFVTLPNFIIHICIYKYITRLQRVDGTRFDENNFSFDYFNFTQVDIFNRICRGAYII